MFDRYHLTSNHFTLKLQTVVLYRKLWPFFTTTQSTDPLLRHQQPRMSFHWLLLLTYTETCTGYHLKIKPCGVWYHPSGHGPSLGTFYAPTKNHHPLAKKYFSENPGVHSQPPKLNASLYLMTAANTFTTISASDLHHHHTLHGTIPKQTRMLMLN